MLTKAHKGSRDRWAPWSALAATTVVLAVAAPAQAAPFVYATNVNFTGSGPGSISQYNSGAGGLLAPLSPPTVATGEFPLALVVSPDGQSVYVALNVSDRVAEYTVMSGGTLAP
jgi:DNA-binding beta-propeller fold protein YncE